jgi:hypothetical protein
MRGPRGCIGDAQGPVIRTEVATIKGRQWSPHAGAPTAVQGEGSYTAALQQQPGGEQSGDVRPCLLPCNRITLMHVIYANWPAVSKGNDGISCLHLLTRGQRRHF